MFQELDLFLSSGEGGGKAPAFLGLACLSTLVHETGKIGTSVHDHIRTHSAIPTADINGCEHLVIHN
jgi:hypothetical protein